MPLPDHDSIKSFIQETLGCGCPEEVFRAVDARRRVRLQNAVEIDCVLIVGRRLLVYIVDEGDGILDEKRLAFYVAEGTKDRDRKGLNRFRLVIVSDAASARKRLEHAFKTLNSNDDKVHLHVIGREENIFSEDPQ